ncbi:MAG: hypothetical protein KDD92_19845 [Caldilineaceae bacterium]|nr:hypothetical protein [Caldilineaceae bacterium]
MTILNLDQRAAQYAQKMIENGKAISEVSKPIDTVERLVTKTLGVLQEQGVYAMLLFLYSRTSDEGKVAPVIRNNLFRLLKDVSDQDGGDTSSCLPGFQDLAVPGDNADAQTALKFYSDHALGDLDRLLLVRELYEQTLIYARYGAKAASSS